VLRKGQTLDEAAVGELVQAGLTEVIAAVLDPGDVAEDECAALLAARLTGPGIGASRAATGRVNLVAETAGLLRVDAGVVDRLNAVDESLTLGTLPDLAVVRPREMLATIKVIPFAVPGATVAAALAVAESQSGALALHPFAPLRVGLVLTELPGLKDSVIAGTIAATEARVRGLTGTLLPPLRCAHETAPIAAALRSLLADGADLLLVAGASAVVDRRDVGPAGIVAAGGEIVHFGMPVDPGNLICLGRIGTRPALVLPGCARSPKMNGIDWVLARLFAGFEVDGAAIARMGVGGLLKETGQRPLPRARAAAAPGTAEAAPARPRIAALVLAAGRSSRMAPHHKLLVTDRAGKPMIARVVDNVLSSGARPVVVVTGHRAEEIEAALAGRPVAFVRAENYADGLSASLKAGIAALPAEDIEAALVCLGDMPLVTGRMIDAILEAYDPDEGRLIVVPTHQGKPGNPMLWDRRFFAEMGAATGDSGARFLLARHGEHVAEVELDADAVLRDFDTVESLDALPPRMRPAPLG
jgi:molybdenum cofactor cytidylyltransferase